MVAQLRLRFPLRGGAHIFFLLGLFLGLASAGCSLKKNEVQSLKTPAPAVSALSPTPQESKASYEKQFAELSSRYQKPLAPQDNGWTEVAPLLEPAVKGMGRHDVLSLQLSQADDLKYFDQKVLPVLQKGFTKPFFDAPSRLLQGQDPLVPYYRSLRILCQLVVQRAQLYLEAKNPQLALQLVQLPLKLARASQSRPQTVSAALFSQNYAQASLDALASWAKEDSLSLKELQAVERALLENKPDYAHLKEAVLVDFAMLDGSLADEETRAKVLGLGLLSEDEVASFRSEAKGLVGVTEASFAPASASDDEFNRAVLNLNPSVQGLILEYPSMLTSLKLGLASFFANQIGFRMKLVLKEGSSPKAGQNIEAIYKQALSHLFASDSQDALLIASFLRLKVALEGEKHGFSLEGAPGYFKLVSPMADPVFFETSF